MCDLLSVRVFVGGVKSKIDKLEDAIERNIEEKIRTKVRTDVMEKERVAVK